MELLAPCLYHRWVRVFLIALMIALLPLRGWVGDAMALSMVVGHAGTDMQTVAPVQMPCHTTSAQMADHAHPDRATHDTTAGSGHGHLLCDLCNGPVLDAQWLWAPVSSEPPVLLPASSERFASQTVRRNVRPPIS